jgi:hypothetical protein
MRRLYAYLQLKKSHPDGTVTTSPANNNLDPNDQKLYVGLFADIYANGGSSGLNPQVDEVYISFVCEYVNRANNRNLPGQIPVCALKDGSFFKYYYYCYETGHTIQHASVELCRDGLEPENFLQVRHLFLLDRSNCGHMALIVISPEARTVDYLDSAQTRADAKMGVVLKLISDHLGSLFKPCEWKVRQGYSPQQYNQGDCAIYTALNAMLIAFGYPIEYTRTDMLNRRYRMATELLNGGNGVFYTKKEEDGDSVPKNQEEFYYELTDYWTGPKASCRSRGFHSLNGTILSFLPQEVQAYARAGKYCDRGTSK